MWRRLFCGHRKHPRWGPRFSCLNPPLSPRVGKYSEPSLRSSREGKCVICHLNPNTVEKERGRTHFKELGQSCKLGGRPLENTPPGSPVPCPRASPHLHEVPAHWPSFWLIPHSAFLLFRVLTLAGPSNTVLQLFTWLIAFLAPISPPLRNFTPHPN